MSLVEMSLSGGVMIIVIILVRALAINRLPKSTFTALWMLALARLLIPVSVPSVFSVYSLFDRTPSVSAPAQSAGTSAAAPFIGSPEIASPTAPPASADSAESAAFSLAYVWLIGAVVTLAAFAAAYFLCFRTLRQSQVVSDPSVEQWLDSHRIRRTITVRASGRVSAPLTYGLFRPVIILPEGMDLSDRERLDYVLSHELAHIRRLDLLRKPTIILAACLHWFNPLVWVMLIIFNRDIELVCDETVVSNAGHSSKKAYAMALIDMEEQRSAAGALYSCFNRNAVEERIVAIMKITRPTFLRLAASAAVVLAVCLGFATTAYANQDKSAEEPASIVISAGDMEDIIVSAAGLPEDTEVSSEAETVDTVAADWVWPVNSDRITRAFGPSPNPDRPASDHITIACQHGESVFSAVGGTVTEAAFVPEYGSYVVVCSEGGVRTMYAHLESISVTVGQTLAAGERLGAAGATGMVTGPCLGFYVYVSEQPVDPTGFYG